MKREINIRSIMRRIDDSSGYCYASVGQNANAIFEAIKRHSLSCEKIDQWCNWDWILTIKGKKKNIRAFVTELTLKTTDIYMIQEY